MKKRYYIKHSPKASLFSQHTGIPTVNIENGLGCTVVAQKTIANGISITLYAYLLYSDFKGKINTGVKISHTCNIGNCVQLDHLIATYTPSKKDIEYINSYLKLDGIEHLAHVLRVPLPAFRQYLKTPKAP